MKHWIFKSNHFGEVTKFQTTIFIAMKLFTNVYQLCVAPNILSVILHAYFTMKFIARSQHFGYIVNFVTILLLHSRRGTQNPGYVLIFQKVNTYLGILFSLVQISKLGN